MTLAHAKVLPAVLVFGGHDPTCGAGIGADILTLASLGCHPLAVVTAVTAQDTHGVTTVQTLDPQVVVEQARAILEDCQVAAFKIGMVGHPDIAVAIAEVVADYPDIPLVIDPVLASGRGDDLGGEPMIAALLDYLIPQATLVTPNVPELFRLTGDDHGDDDDGDADASLDPADTDDPEAHTTDPHDAKAIAARAQHLLEDGVEFILVTGTHANTPEVINRLFAAEGELRCDRWDRLPASYHGSGCTLAAAIAGCIARGLDLKDAVFEAQTYTYQSLQQALRVGMGQLIPNRLFWADDDDDNSDASDHA
jgi:hydroxymethylpyrimidine/phosphomethylpyrimidine kinase